MSGDIGHLQRLTDEQVRARLAAYNPNGSLDRDLKLTDVYVEGAQIDLAHAG